ncbi:MAG: hypothetical protein QXF14_04515, partial [Candidatus Woesearchaeota archaeon]
GGWGYDEQFEALAADASRRSAFVAGLTRFVQDYNLDIASRNIHVLNSKFHFLLLHLELRA